MLSVNLRKLEVISEDHRRFREEVKTTTNYSVKILHDDEVVLACIFYSKTEETEYASKQTHGVSLQVITILLTEVQ